MTATCAGEVQTGSSAITVVMRENPPIGGVDWHKSVKGPTPHLTFKNGGLLSFTLVGQTLGRPTQPTPPSAYELPYLAYGFDPQKGG
jgi:hypothetical protein